VVRDTTNEPISSEIALFKLYPISIIIILIIFILLNATSNMLFTAPYFE